MRLQVGVLAARHHPVPSTQSHEEVVLGSHLLPFSLLGGYLGGTTGIWPASRRSCGTPSAGKST